MKENTTVVTNEAVLGSHPKSLLFSNQSSELEFTTSYCLMVRFIHSQHAVITAGCEGLCLHGNRELLSAL